MKKGKYPPRKTDLPVQRLSMKKEDYVIFIRQTCMMSIGDDFEGDRS